MKMSINDLDLLNEPIKSQQITRLKNEIVSSINRYMDPLTLRRKSIKLPKLQKQPPTLASSLDVTLSAYQSFNIYPSYSPVTTVVHGVRVKRYRSPPPTHNRAYSQLKRASTRLSSNPPFPITLTPVSAADAVLSPKRVKVRIFPPMKNKNSRSSVSPHSRTVHTREVKIEIDTRRVKM